MSVAIVRAEHDISALVGSGQVRMLRMLVHRRAILMQFRTSSVVRGLARGVQYCVEKYGQYLKLGAPQRLAGISRR